MLFRLLAPILCTAVTLTAQPPIQINTTVRSFTPVPTSQWVAECESYTDPMGRDFALICRGNSGFSVYEVTNPAVPVFASSIAATGSDLKDVKIKDDIAYCVQQSGNVLVVSLANPYAIQIVNQISSNGGHNGNAQGNVFAYSRDGGSPNGLEFYDITNPASPVFRSLYDPPGFRCHDAELDENGTICYAHTFFDNTTHILDVSNPASPQVLGIIPYGNHSGATYHAPGGRVIHGAMVETAGGHMRIYDVTDPASPLYLSSYQPPTATNISIHNAITVENRYVAIAYYADYLRILDMGNPSNPIEVGVYDPDASNIGAAVFDGAWSVAHVRTLPSGVQRYILTESFRSPEGFWVIDFTPPPTIDIDAVTTGVGDGVYTVSGVDPLTDIFNLFSLATSGPMGLGPIAGIGADAFSGALAPVGSFFSHPVTDANGDYTTTIGPSTFPPGFTVDLVTFGRKTGIWVNSAVGRITF